MDQKPESIPVVEDRRVDQKPSGKKAVRPDRKGHSVPKKVPLAASTSRRRTTRPYPASSFREALPLAEAIHEYASGEKVRRLTLLKQLDKSPNSSITKMLITNSAKYDLTKGGYSAEWLELTELGSKASAPNASPRGKLQAQFNLAIDGIPPFQRLYSEYKGKKLPTHDVLKDVVADGDFGIDNLNECVDLFIVNAKDMGLLQTIAGSEMLIPIEQVLDELGEKGDEPGRVQGDKGGAVHAIIAELPKEKVSSPKINWSKTCFIITPIGEEGSETRQHADSVDPIFMVWERRWR